MAGRARPQDEPGSCSDVDLGRCRSTSNGAWRPPGLERRSNPGENTMRYMMLVKADANYEAGRPPTPALMEAIGKLSVEMTKAGVLLQSGGLLPSSRGARVRVAGGKATVTDG